MIGVASKVDANRRRSRTPLSDLGGWPAQPGRRGSICAEFGVEFELRSVCEGSDDSELSGLGVWRRSKLPAASGIQLPPAGAPKRNDSTGVFVGVCEVMSDFVPSRLARRPSAIVKSFGRRQASESRRGTNPRCAGRGLWGFDVLVVPGWAVATCARLDRMRVARAFPGDPGQYRRRLIGRFGDRGRDRRA